MKEIILKSKWNNAFLKTETKVKLEPKYLKIQLNSKGNKSFSHSGRSWSLWIVARDQCCWRIVHAIVQTTWHSSGVYENAWPDHVTDKSTCFCKSHCLQV